MYTWAFYTCSSVPVPCILVCSRAVHSIVASCTSALHARPVCSRAVHSVTVHRLVPWQPDLFILRTPVLLHLVHALLLCSRLFCTCEFCTCVLRAVCIVYVLRTCARIPDMCIRWWHMSVSLGLDFLVHSAFVTSDLDPASLCNRCLHLGVNLILLFECKSDFAVPV